MTNGAGLVKTLEPSVSVTVRILNPKHAAVSGAPTWFFQDDGAVEDVHEYPTVYVTLDYRIDYYLPLRNDQRLTVLRVG